MLPLSILCACNVAGLLCPEIQYNPSCWVTRIPREEALPQHINITTKASNIARERVPNRLNLRYGCRKEQLLDLYGTDLPPGAPIFVYIHGGYWQKLSKDISAYPAIPLRQAGIRSAIVGYDLAPNVTLDVIVREIREMAVFILNIAKEEKTKETAIRQSPMFKYGDLQLQQSFTVLITFARQDTPSFRGQAFVYRKVIEKKNPWIKTKIVEIKGETDHFNMVANLQYPNYELTRYIIRLIKNGL